MKSFLIVEENKRLRRLYETIIKINQDNPRIDHAVNGRDALTMVRDHNYSVIISDIEMPGMDGMEFHQTLKAKFPPSAKKVMFITSPLDGFERSYMSDEGCPHLIKPFLTKDILSNINSILEKE